MTPERMQRIYELFEQAVRLPADQRAGFLRRVCGDDAALRVEVESLLVHDSLCEARAASEVADSGSADADAMLTGSADGGDGTHSEPPQIPGYKIIRELGRGGMGIVYQAIDQHLDCMVAIKTVTGSFENSDLLLQQEAKLAAQLRHPNIVSIHAFVDSCDPPCFIMEWVDGVPLDVASAGLDAREIARLMLKVVRAVAYAHNKGVVHRDLKPGNILVDRHGEPRLLDFGLARSAVRRGDSTLLPGIKGTPCFMAPEQFLAPFAVGPAADIYALGLILYRLLTGALPPEPTSPADIGQWARRQLPLPRELDPGIPEPLQRICLKACEPEPRERYHSAAELARDLERFLDGREVRARPRRYAQLLGERVRGHLQALRDWVGDRLITQREADALEDRYLRLLRTESLWVPGARRLRAGAVILQAGGWLVVLSTILWASFYWNDLTRAQRVLAVGFPTVIINAAAVVLWRRFSELVGLIFSVIGALLIPLFLLVLFSEFGILATRASDTFELLTEAYFTNRQLAAAFWISAVYVGLLTWRKAYGAFAALFCLMCVLSVAASLLLIGMKDWLTRELYATTAAAFSPVPVVAYLVARWLDRPRREQLSVPFYAVAGVGFLVIIATLAHDAPKTWLRLTPPEDASLVNPLNVCRELLFVCAGLTCFLLALIHDRSTTRLRRLWAALYFRVVPPCCLIPVDLLGNEPLWSLGTLGNAELRPLEFGVPALCILAMVLGTRLQLRWFTYYGLLHLAVFTFRITQRHFADYLSWPVAVLIVGAVAMIVGLWLEHRRLVSLEDRAAEAREGWPRR